MQLWRWPTSIRLLKNLWESTRQCRFLLEWLTLTTNSQMDRKSSKEPKWSFPTLVSKEILIYSQIQWSSIQIDSVLRWSKLDTRFHHCLLEKVCCWRFAMLSLIETSWFSAGPRFCIGMRFGSLQTKLAIALLLANFKFSPCERTENPVTINPVTLIYGPASKVWLNVSRVSSWSWSFALLFWVLKDI